MCRGCLWVQGALCVVDHRGFLCVALKGEEQDGGNYFGLALATQKAGNATVTGAKTKRVRSTNVDYDETGDPWRTVECDANLGSEERDKTIRLLALKMLKEEALSSQASGYTTTQAHPPYRKTKKDGRLPLKCLAPGCTKWAVLITKSISRHKGETYLSQNRGQKHDHREDKRKRSLKDAAKANILVSGAENTPSSTGAATLRQLRNSSAAMPSVVDVTTNQVTNFLRNQKPGNMVVKGANFGALSQAIENRSLMHMKENNIGHIAGEKYDIHTPGFTAGSRVEVDGKGSFTSSGLATEYMLMLNVKAQDERLCGSVKAADATHKIDTEKTPLIGWGTADKTKHSHLTQLQVSANETKETFVHGKQMERHTTEALVSANQRLREKKTAGEEPLAGDWLDEGTGLFGEGYIKDDDLQFILQQQPEQVKEAIDNLERDMQSGVPAESSKPGETQFMVECFLSFVIISLILYLLEYCEL